VERECGLPYGSLEVDDAWSGFAAVLDMVVLSSTKERVRRTCGAYYVRSGIHMRANTNTSTSSCSIAPYDASARCAIDDQRPPLLCLM
jgi:hypothetical protein